MPSIIRLLPDTIANQIAAGEVVQRPASVVKELIENAIDAESSTIKVIIKEAGKTLIQVIDNGKGMSEVDARMSFEKHATSKITKATDLFNIQTMGFRGEALASIAAVAQLEMESCLEEETLGTRIVIEGAEVKTQTPVSAPQGTKVSVKNLFFNIPARRNFLKSDPVETKHILDEFQRAALARPDVAFALYQNDTETYQLPATKLSHRIVHLFGNAHKKQLIFCQESTDLLKIQGYVGQPAHAKKTRGEQFLFVNQRFIKSPYLNHAVKNAFEGLLAKETFPFYVLFIDIAPARIDVNVHPTKTEIKFENEQMVYALLTATIKKALATHQVTSSIDFEQATNLNPLAAFPPSAASSASERNYAQFRQSADSKPDNAKDWTKLFAPLDKLPSQEALATTPATLLTAGPWQPMPENKFKIQLHRQYLLVQVKAGLLLIDQRAAHERVLYEQYLQPLLSSQAHSAQQLLFPVHITLNPADLALVQAHERDLQALGFALASLGKDSLVVNACPAEVAAHDLKQLLEGLIEQFKQNQAQFSLTTQENLARSLAKRACMQPGKKLQEEEIDLLIDQLFACENPNYTPEGGRTFVVLTLEDVGRVFSA